MAKNKGQRMLAFPGSEGSRCGLCERERHGRDPSGVTPCGGVAGKQRAAGPRGGVMVPAGGEEWSSGRSPGRCGGWDSGGAHVGEKHRGGPELTPPQLLVSRRWVRREEPPHAGQEVGRRGGAYGAEMGAPAHRLSLGGC